MHKFESGFLDVDFVVSHEFPDDSICPENGGLLHVLDEAGVDIQLLQFSFQFFRDDSSTGDDDWDHSNIGNFPLILDCFPEINVFLNFPHR